MRIACYGFVDKDAGSVATANFLILNELLRRGHHVDFYAKRDFVYPHELCTSDSFHYVGVELPRWSQLEKWAIGLPRSMEYVTTELIYRAYLRVIRRRMRRRHQRQPYDVLLFLGVGAQFAIPGLPTVSWLQGPPQTERQSIQRHRETIIELAGRTFYTKLIGFYLWKEHVADREIRRCNTIICGSEWSRQQIIAYGVEPERVRALPYPIDLNIFSPDPQVPALRNDRHTFLWLGRIDPRKRLDLALDAFASLIEKRRDVHLYVVGRTTYLPQYLQLLDQFPYPDHVTYLSHLDRTDVPNLIRGADILLQPSENENFGSSVAEALCCGRPSILGPSNGTGEYTFPGTYSFDTHHSASLAEAMHRSLDALEDNRTSLETICRQTAEANFSTFRVVDELESILQEHVAPESLSRASSPLAGAVS